VRGAVAEKGPEDERYREGPEGTKRRSGEGSCRRRNGRPDDGAVGASRDFNQQRIAVTFAGVVLQEAGAEAGCFDAYRVVDGGVVGAAAEDVAGDAVFLERLVGVGEGTLDDVAKEELAAVSAGEAAGVQDALKLRSCVAVFGQ